MGTGRRTSATGLDARARARELSARFAERENQLQVLAASFLDIRAELDRKAAAIVVEMETLGCGIPEIGERVDESSREIRRLKALASSGGVKSSRGKEEEQTPPVPAVGSAGPSGHPSQGDRLAGVATEA